MSKLYDVYVYLKKSSNENNVLYLFKSGIFYLFIDKDAILASNILGLKLTNLTDNILKCGFPTTSLEKYSKILSHCNYTLKIVDPTSEIIFNYSQYKLKSNIQQFLEELSNIDTDNCSIKEAYEKLESYKERATNILSSIN